MEERKLMATGYHMVSKWCLMSTKLVQLCSYIRLK